MNQQLPQDLMWPGSELKELLIRWRRFNIS